MCGAEVGVGRCPVDCPAEHVDHETMILCDDCQEGRRQSLSLSERASG